MRRVRSALAVARALRRAARIPPEDWEALAALADWAADENLRPRRSPGIDPAAVVSPLASLRFAERVAIGPRANVGPYACVWGGWSTTWARVGAGALLGPGAVLVAGNHRTAGPGAIRDLGFDERDVEVGDGAWIGAHAVIVGCRVGAGAVVAAGSVVLEDVPERAIAAGAPARVVGQREA